MPNYSYYEMKIKGTKKNVEKCIRAMRWEGEYADNGVGRVFNCDIIEQNDNFTIVGGDCAWSISSAMRKGENENNIEKLSKKLNLSIEAYSEEPGCEFQEHFCVINGNIQLDECVDYIETYEEDVPELDDCFWTQQVVVEAGVTKDNYTDYLADGYLHIGGYSSWDWLYV